MCICFQDKYCIRITWTYSISFSLFWKIYKVHFCELCTGISNQGLWRCYFVRMYYQMSTSPSVQISVYQFPPLAALRRNSFKALWVWDLQGTIKGSHLYREKRASIYFWVLYKLFTLQILLLSYFLKLKWSPKPLKQ